MIFLTVGTSHFDTLIQVVDNLIGSGAIEEPVLAQIGSGKYIPKNMQYVRLLKDLNHAYRVADVIVSSGGAGTTLECATRGLKLVVVENTSVMEGHQQQLIEELERRGHLIWCKELNRLVDCIDIAKTQEFKPFETDPPRMHRLIRRLIQNGKC